MSAYYNEFDPFAASWLRELIRAKLIADGEVDERSITEVRPEELRGFTQCHFFAGIGGWSYALRLAGWPDTRSVWTGSCPCQPFSSAGKGAVTDDSRHLWPAFFKLIEVCRPPVVAGEQVASADGRAWLDLVFTDLEGSAYRVGAANLCAAGVGAPHIRQRLYWIGDVADADVTRGQRHNATESSGNGPDDGLFSRNGASNSSAANTDQQSITSCRQRELPEGSRPTDRTRSDEHDVSGLVDIVADTSEQREQREQRDDTGTARQDGTCTDESDGGSTVSELDDTPFDEQRSRRDGSAGREEHIRPSGAPIELAHSKSEHRRRQPENNSDGREWRSGNVIDAVRASDFVADADRDGLGVFNGKRRERNSEGQLTNGLSCESGGINELADASSNGQCEVNGVGGPAHRSRPSEGSSDDHAISFWSSVTWLPCRDGKSRAVESLVEPLADGLSNQLGCVRLASGETIIAPLIEGGKNRVGRLKGYGNAICPQLAAEFIKAYIAATERA